MSIDSAPDDLLHASLLGLRGVSAKKLFGDQAFFVAGRMFAFQRDGALVLKLPERETPSPPDDGWKCGSRMCGRPTAWR